MVGLAGVTGVVGLAGVSGVVGLAGVSGVVGLAGVSGVVGLAGVVGLEGVIVLRRVDIWTALTIATTCSYREQSGANQSCRFDFCIHKFESLSI